MWSRSSMFRLQNEAVFFATTLLQFGGKKYFENEDMQWRWNTLIVLWVDGKTHLIAVQWVLGRNNYSRLVCCLLSLVGR